MRCREAAAGGRLILWSKSGKWCEIIVPAASIHPHAPRMLAGDGSRCLIAHTLRSKAWILRPENVKIAPLCGFIKQHMAKVCHETLSHPNLLHIDNIWIHWHNWSSPLGLFFFSSDRTAQVHNTSPVGKSKILEIKRWDVTVKPWNKKSIFSRRAVYIADVSRRRPRYHPPL